MVKLYRKKPVVIKALHLIPTITKEEILDFCPIANVGANIETGKIVWIVIPTLEGDHAAGYTDYLIEGIAGEFYPCREDIFEKTYEEV